MLAPQILAALEGRYNVHLADLLSKLGCSEQVFRFAARDLLRRRMIRETQFPAYSTFALEPAGMAELQRAN